MRKIFALPTQNEKLCSHFGHCENFTVIETKEGNIINKMKLNPPIHEPGAYPKFLAEQGINIIIAGGMGQKAQDLFLQNNIEVVFGVEPEDPEILVANYLQNSLVSGNNKCDH